MAEPNSRLNAATEAVLRSFDGVTQDKAREIAREALMAAARVDDPPKPKWPTNESVIAYFGATENNWSESRYDESHRERLGASFLADPVIRAAVALRDEARAPGRVPNTFPIFKYQELLEAVNKAGL